MTALTIDDPHVFVTRGDLLHLACDAWLLSTDQRLSVRDHWLTPHGFADRLTEPWPSAQELRTRIRAAVPQAFLDGDQLATPVFDWPAGPVPVVTAVPLHGVQGADDEVGLTHVRRAVAEFIRVGRDVAMRAAASSDRKRRPLLAMPSFATQGGGGGRVRGTVLAAMLEAATQTVRELGDVDVVIVVRHAKTFAHLQSLRRGSLPHLGALQATVESLATHASTGRLVPFMGSGVSASAGGPTWAQLIRRLAEPLFDKAEVEDLTKDWRSALDQAAIIEDRFHAKNPEAGPQAFRKLIADQVRLTHYGLAPALLASLSVSQAITLNYDDLFEQAHADVHGDGKLSIIGGKVMPHQAEKWLLKLHGTIEHPDSIVLTRDDYLGFATSRNVLSAIVKANLITHHLLFVGFGLSDDHFTEIIHDVRRAMPKDTGVKFGTALQLTSDPLMRNLVGADLDLHVTTGLDDTPDKTGRRVEVVLDVLLALASDGHEFLLADDFETALSEEDLALRDALLTLRSTMPDKARHSSAWPVVESAFRALGAEFGNTDSRGTAV